MLQFTTGNQEAYFCFQCVNENPYTFQPYVNNRAMQPLPPPPKQQQRQGKPARGTLSLGPSDHAKPKQASTDLLHYGSASASGAAAASAAAAAAAAIGTGGGGGSGGGSDRRQPTRGKGQQRRAGAARRSRDDGDEDWKLEHISGSDSDSGLRGRQQKQQLRRGSGQRWDAAKQNVSERCPAPYCRWLATRRLRLGPVQKRTLLPGHTRPHQTASRPY